jgi:hypothetical protein
MSGADTRADGNKPFRVEFLSTMPTKMSPLGLGKMERGRFYSRHELARVKESADFAIDFA